MAQLDEASGKIGKIIRVIEEIAFQTNTRALSAAVDVEQMAAAVRQVAEDSEAVTTFVGRSSVAAMSSRRG